MKDWGSPSLANCLPDLEVYVKLPEYNPKQEKWPRNILCACHFLEICSQDHFGWTKHISIEALKKTGDVDNLNSGTSRESHRMFAHHSFHDSESMSVCLTKTKDLGPSTSWKVDRCLPGRLVKAL